MPEPSRPVARFPADHRRLWSLYLAVGGVVVVGYHLVPQGLATTFLYQLIGMSSVAALLVGVRLNRPERPVAWYLMAAGLALWSIADAVGDWWATVLGIAAYPTPADPVYLLGYVIVTVGILLLIRAQHHSSDLPGILDSLILTTSLAMLSWVLLARPILETYRESPLAALVAVNYPIADIVLTGLLIRLVTTSSGRTRSFRLLVAALVLLIAADTASSALRLLTFDDSRPLDVLWLVSYLLWGAAALHPSMVAFSAPAGPSITRFSRGRLAALTVAVLIAPVTLGVQAWWGVTLTVWAVVLFSIIAFLLVVARMNLSIQQIQAANAERAAAEAQLRHQAAHDPLTGLANRAQVIRQISGALGRGQRTGAVVGLLFIDLDGFKQVNDTLGHHAGDEVLRAVGERMQSMVRPGDVVARLGGDEFVVLLEPLDEQASAVVVAERIIGAVSEPIRLPSAHEARIGASAGLAISQDADTDADRLLLEADLAVYRAKAAGRGRIEVFDRDLRERMLSRARLEEAIRGALADDTAELSLRPIVGLVTGELGGVEARVCCPVEGEPMDRDALIAELGRSPAIIEFDAWALHRAAAAVAALSADRAGTVVTVPLTVHHLLLNRIRDDIADALASSGATAAQLEVMVPADELGDDLRLLANLDTLRSWGVSVCLDRFIAGAAPTSRLLQLPVTAVRLDETLLRDAMVAAGAGDLAADRPAAGGAPSPLELLRLTVQTARTFGYRAIAPQLDDAAALTAALAADCEFGQGAAAAELLQHDPAEPEPLSRRAVR